MDAVEILLWVRIGPCRAQQQETRLLFPPAHTLVFASVTSFAGPSLCPRSNWCAKSRDRMAFVDGFYSSFFDNTLRICIRLRLVKAIPYLCIWIKEWEREKRPVYDVELQKTFVLVKCFKEHDLCFKFVERLIEGQIFRKEYNISCQN